MTFLHPLCPRQSEASVHSGYVALLQTCQDLIGMSSTPSSSLQTILQICPSPNLEARYLAGLCNVLVDAGHQALQLAGMGDRQARRVQELAGNPHHGILGPGQEPVHLAGGQQGRKLHREVAILHGWSVSMAGWMRRAGEPF